MNMIDRRYKYWADIFKEHPQKLQSITYPQEEKIDIIIEPYEPILKRRYTKEAKEAVDYIKKKLGIKRLRTPRKDKFV